MSNDDLDRELAEMRTEMRARIREVEVRPARDAWREGIYDLVIHADRLNSTSIACNPLELRAWGEAMIAGADEIEAVSGDEPPKLDELDDDLIRVHASTPLTPEGAHALATTLDEWVARTKPWVLDD